MDYRQYYAYFQLDRENLASLSLFHNRTLRVKEVEFALE